MKLSRGLLGVSALTLFAVITALQAQTLTPIAPPAFTSNGPVIRSQAMPGRPFTVAGERGVLVGDQQGSFESWVLPVKLLSGLTIEAEVEGYTAPIDLNQEVASLEVRPDRTVITYSHIGLTVRQIMFSPSEVEPGLGPIVLFEFDCLHPTHFVFRFTPELKWMWPERSEGTPGLEWEKSLGGYYVLHGDYPDLGAAVALPGAQPGILAPYQERPKVYPAELRLSIDPKRDRGKLFPLLMAVGLTAETSTNQALGRRLQELNQHIGDLYQQHAARWQKFLETATRIETPDRALDEAFTWSAISIEQLRARALSPQQLGLVPAAGATPAGELGLVAGYFESADSARPGFGWFFGRDSLYTIPAIDGYGDYALARAELEFLARRQRDDGKIMHEFSQTAELVEWRKFPYMFAAADATPLYLLAVEDYLRSSGDTGFLTTWRDSILKAWNFETTHDADGDGIYDNAQGTGWVESWPTGMPRQEIYMALLDQQASSAMASLATRLGDAALADAAKKRASAIAVKIETEYYDPAKGCYAFSHNPDGSQDRTRTVYPALAWWTGDSTLAHSGECLRQLAAHSLNTDWGLRDVADDEPFYDGMSYHQGSVWPLFTGWAALAEYRGGQPLAGYQILKENANLTWAQDLGSHTELLSGDFYVPMGRSTSHQLWSSAMVITPTLKGLFGLDIDAEHKVLTVNPHLPASWNHADVLELPLGGEKAWLNFDRNGSMLEVSLNPMGTNEWKLRTDLPGASLGPLDVGREAGLKGKDRLQGLRIPLPELEVDLTAGDLNLIESVAANQPTLPPTPGSRTRQFRVLNAEYQPKSLKLTIEGLAGSSGILTVVPHGHILPKATTEVGGARDASISYRACDANFYACKTMPLVVNFPDGEGWKTITVTLTW